MSAAVGRLSNAEIVALGNAVLIDERGVVVGFDHTVVEQIVQQHIAAFKAEAVAAIEAECPTNTRDGFMCPPCRQSVRLIEALDP